MARFDRAIQTALRLIKKNGQLVQWQTVRDGSPLDPLKPWNKGPSITTENDVEICFLTIDRQTMETFGFMENAEVQKGSVMGLMGAVSFDANLKDVVIRDGKELRIAAMNKLSPNGQIVLHTIIFKA